MSNKTSLIPVLTDWPWNDYKERYRIKYGSLFGVTTSRSISCQTFMICTIAGRKVEEHI
ncbi:hypothetical protein F5X98DRAFT_339988 [Xylaria grammica]|nr:hypothetical protein F5X98DRAFT_339988 [Xylaria grammica]